MGREIPFRDYPTTYPAVFADAGFSDDSWHNESAGRLTLAHGAGFVVLWVAEPDPDAREYPEAPRFGLSWQPGEYAEGCEDIGETDDPDAVLSMVKAFVAGEVR